MKIFTRTSTVVLTLLALAFGTIGVRPARAATTWTVTSLADSSTANAANCPHASNCRLRDAVAAAVTGDTIVFASGLSGGTIYLANPITLSKNLTIDGSALASKITLSGDSDNNGTGNVRIFSIYSSSGYGLITILLNRLIITKGVGGNEGGMIFGGGIYNEGTLTVMNSNIFGNSAELGGGIYSYGPLTVTNSTLSNNISSQQGGGIDSVSASTTVTDSIFTGNTAVGGQGGGIYVDGFMNITNSQFINNTASGCGGVAAGSFVATQSSAITNSVITANAGGGGICNSGMLSITNSNVSSNYGNGVINSGTLTITNSIISDNHVSLSHSKGGGIQNIGVLTIENSTISGNGVEDDSATDTYGGGIYNSGALVVANSTIANNSVVSYSPFNYHGKGGGMYNDGTLTIINSTVYGNRSDGSVGGIVNGQNATLNYSNTIISHSYGPDCANYSGNIETNINNLVHDGTCSPSLSGDPKLSPLANNGGLTMTLALLDGSPAIDAGDDAVCAANPVNNTSQNNVLRPQGTHCDIGSYELAHTRIVRVNNITTIDSNPTRSNNEVKFSVVFSDPVSGVGVNDFLLSITGITGAYINNVDGNGANYIVTVHTGGVTSTKGTIRLDLIDDDTIIDGSGTLLGGYGFGNGDFLLGEEYEVLRTPILIVPGIAGTFAMGDTEQDYKSWLLNRGVNPSQLTVDPLGHVYDDLIQTLKNAGYVEGQDLFVVLYDWRLPPAPMDGVYDGHINGLTATNISDTSFEYGVDYLGLYLELTAQKWEESHPGVPLDKVDVIAHSTGGLIVRSYIESNAYGGLYEGANHLPTIDNLIMIGVPNRGAAKAWNPLQNDWKDDFAYQFLLSKILNHAYQKLVRDNQNIYGLDYPNNSLTKTSPDLLTNGSPDPMKFIQLYVPTIRGLLATYNFLNSGSGAENINDNNSPYVSLRNDLLLDLNNGFDTSSPGDPNVFTTKVGKVTVIYGNGKQTQIGTSVSTAPAPTVDLVTGLVTSPAMTIPFTSVTGQVIPEGAPWYLNTYDVGDGTVPVISSYGQFQNCSCATTQAFSGVDHTGLMSDAYVQSYILSILGYDNFNNISIGLSKKDFWKSLKLSVLNDPVEFVLTDGLGRRFGYTTASGPLTEIPDSVWHGGADGLGWISNNIQEPFTTQINGLNESYYVMVSGTQLEEGGTILSGDNLASGTSITIPIVFIETDAALPTVNSFAAPVSSASLNIPITTFTASDNKGVTGYMVTNSSTPPAADATGWSGAAPTVYAVSSNGNYTLYPWVKDAAGNVSAVYNSPVTVTVTAFVVSNTNDSGAGSLRATIASATSGSTIVFAPALSGQTIYLASTLTLTKNVTIDGSDMPLKITISGDSDQDGTGDVRVFAINSGVTALFNSLIIAKGKVDSNSFYGFGGGVYNNGNLTITNSTLSNNSAVWGGGIFNYSGSALVVTKSTFSGNSASEGGGGIANSGSLIVKASTISGNLAAYSGGGVYNNYSGTLALTNSTVSGNSVSGDGGGIYNYFGALTLSNSTISENSAALGGGVRNWSGLFKYSNTIIANSNLGGDCAVNNSISVNTNNLVEDGSCSASLSGDPKLGLLANNGGVTQTMALKAGSPAIDTGSDSVCSQTPVDNLDQRGLARPVDSHCDIGAYEGSLPDTSKPVVSAFAVPATSVGLNIPITTFTATDNVAVTGYKVTTSSTPPGAGAAGWTASAPTTFAVGAPGTYTLYPWAKDAAGNVSAIFGSPRTVLVMKERSKNGGFETYTGASKIPTNWSAGNTFSTSDGKDTNVHREGAASVKIVGAAGKTKRLAQTINLSGASGDKFVFTFWVKGNSIPATGLCRGEVQFYNGATLTQTKAINCSTGTTGFQKKSVTFTVNAAYTKIVIRFTYSKASGTVWFDGVSLMK